jgi:hypothetical protein
MFGFGHVEAGRLLVFFSLAVFFGASLEKCSHSGYASFQILHLIVQIGNPDTILCLHSVPPPSNRPGE